MRAGLHPLARNVRCKVGEIDLIMQAGPVLVFVEVRARESTHFGPAAASVGSTKRARLIRAAAYLLPLLTQQYWHGQEPPVRFDVVAFDGDSPQWLRHAFMR
jgi:putative endonuclease